MGFEPTQKETNRLSVHHLNLSTTSSSSSSLYNMNSSDCQFHLPFNHHQLSRPCSLHCLSSRFKCSHYQEHNRKKDECLTNHCGWLIQSDLDQMQWASTNIVINFPIITTSLWCNRLVCLAVNRKVGGSSPPRDDFSSVSQI